MKNLRICPKCNLPTLRTALNVSGWLSPEYFECKNCGYLGSLYLEINLDEISLENKELNI